MSDVLAERIEAAWRRLRQSHWDRAHHDNDETVAEAFAAADAVLWEHADEVWWCAKGYDASGPGVWLDGHGDCSELAWRCTPSCGPRFLVDPAWLARGGDV